MLEMVAIIFGSLANLPQSELTAEEAHMLALSATAQTEAATLADGTASHGAAGALTMPGIPAAE